MKISLSADNLPKAAGLPSPPRVIAVIAHSPEAMQGRRMRPAFGHRAEGADGRAAARLFSLGPAAILLMRPGLIEPCEKS